MIVYTLERRANLSDDRDRVIGVFSTHDLAVKGIHDYAGDRKITRDYGSDMVASNTFRSDDGKYVFWITSFYVDE